MQKSGFVTFARFMELALYCPLYGYYEKEKDTAGRRGDFFTSVSVGSLFGELLASQFAAWLLEDCDRKSSTRKSPRPEVKVIEAGAHDGRLAKDILLWLREHQPALFRQLKYCLLEPSPRRQAWQQQTLSEFPERVLWADSWADLRKTLANETVSGIIFCNELLDALPVHRLGWDAGKKCWFEWGVAWRDEKFVWVKIPDQMEAIPKPRLEAKLLNVLPDGFTTEICPAAETWWREAAGMLNRGRLLTIDYGLTAGEFFTPERRQGTLRAYHRHHLNPDLLARPGDQDLTAHVNFSAIQAVGEAAGLHTEAFLRQEKFLVQIAERLWRDSTRPDQWTAGRIRQFQTLVHPEHLGQRFRVLIQSRH